MKKIFVLGYSEDTVMDQNMKAHFIGKILGVLSTSVNKEIKNSCVFFHYTCSVITEEDTYQFIFLNRELFDMFMSTYE